MKMKYNVRKWHARLSIVFVLPMLIVGITAFLMAHEKVLGLKNITWGTKKHVELRKVFYNSNGMKLLATKHGVYRLTDDQLEPIPQLQGMEIRSFSSLDNKYILVAGKQGLWHGILGGKWKLIYLGDIHYLQVTPDGHWHIVVKDEGLLSSIDQGLSWQKDVNLARSITHLPPEQRDLGNLIHDLHTGKALFGKSAEWIWIDILGFVLVFLCLSGVWMWCKTKRCTIYKYINFKG